MRTFINYLRNIGVTDNEVATLKNCTSEIQSQINSKASASSISNIDNTSDANKPVSTAQATAIGAKIPKVAAQTLYVAGIGTVAENYAELAAAYALAKTMTPYGNALATGNRVTIVIAPGLYNDGSTLNVDTQFIDLVSLTGKADIILSGINVTANDVYLKGISTGTATFTIATALNMLKCENCIGLGILSFRSGINFGGTVSGTFINCIGGDYSFGGSYTYPFVVSGTFINCIGGINGFGGQGTVSGTFTNCIGGDNSFGNDAGTLIGKLYWCRLTSGTFQTVSGAGQTRMCLDGTNTLNNQG
ncbi:MAG: hypothetical protein M0P61_05860 [Ignavibacteriaceae bacterium]|nr:hypothetical protein [Ignavibacteriaceae bacterium]